MQLLNEAQVFETWSPILEEKTGITSPDKLKWMSKYAHFHSLNEGFTYPQASLLNTPGMGNVAPASTVAGGAANFYSTSAQGSGDKFPSLLPLAIQVAARTIGFDIVSVVPMNGPAGVLTYLDYIYAGGRDPRAPGVSGQLGLTGNASFTDKFLVFKLNRSTLATDSSQFAGFLGTGAAGDQYVLASAAAPGAKALLVAYVGKSRIDGGQIFRVIAESSSISGTAGTGTFNVIPDFNTQAVTLADIFDGSTVVSKLASNVAFSGVSTVTVSNTTTLSGSLTGYAELVRALEDHVFGFAGAGPQDSSAFAGDATNGLTPYEPMRRGIGETEQYRTMGLQAFTKFVEAETFQVAATVTTEQIQDLNRQYGIDVVSMMENALVNEISQSINKHILSRAFALGWQNHSDFYSVDGVNLNLTLNSSSTASSSASYGARFIGKENSLVTVPLPALQNYGGSTSNFENQGTVQRRIQSKVLAAGNVIAQRGRRGPGNFVVTNLQIATALQDSAQFTFYPLANTINQNNGALYPLGTIAGMTVYVDPNMNYSDTRVLVGRKGADEEPGLKFCPYLMAESIQTIAEGTMAPKLAVKSRYALVEAGFHPQTQYFTFLVNLRNVAATGLWDQSTGDITIA